MAANRTRPPRNPYEEPAILIERLLSPEVYPHDVQQIELLQTHISWVVLTGPYAYKIKKPVDFGFVDYSTPARRKAFCDLEIKLNRRFAPELYLGVVPIFEDPPGYRMGDVIVAEQGACDDARPVVEYAVKMRQFSQDAIVAKRLHHPELTPGRVQAFGVRLAEFHRRLSQADTNRAAAEPAHVLQDVQENFTVVRRFNLSAEVRHSLLQIERWTTSQTDNMLARLHQRLADGKVRRCHGDLHLGNMIQIEGWIHAFDGIEFNEYFQWIDVLSELAFPVMDFIARGRFDLGWRLLNAYLEATGDYLDLDVLRFYTVYRAMVRAKVSLLNDDQANEGANEASAPEGEWTRYIDVAEQFAIRLQPALSITHGFSGSGKSTQAIQQIDARGGIRIRTDVERHRRFAVSDQIDKYAPEFTDRVYEWAGQLAASALQAGFPVIVDGTFLKKKHRARFARLAEDMGLDFEIIDCRASYEDLCRRICQRNHDPSEATVAVLDRQIQTHDPLTPEEQAHVRPVDSS